MSAQKKHLAILGAGPTGLEAALAAAERGFPFTLYEAAGTVAGNVAEWGHVRLFTPWELIVSPRMRRALEAAGRSVPEGSECPTGDDLIAALYEPLAELPQIAPNLRLAERVWDLGRQGLVKNDEIGTPERARRPFRLLVIGEDGDRIDRADVVLDCTGSYEHPNTLGDGGIPAPGEAMVDGEIERRVPDLELVGEDYAGRRTLLVGGGYSAQTAARDLAERAPGTKVVWALRGDEPQTFDPATDPLPERARLSRAAQALAAGSSPAVEVKRGVVVERLARKHGALAVTLRHRDGREEEVTVDRILALTGSVGDHELYRQLQVHECYATCGPMKLSAALLGAGGGDCLAQTSHGADTLVNPEPGFFILGAKSYGRNNTFLMRVGWEQVEEVFGIL